MRMKMWGGEKNYQSVDGPLNDFIMCQWQLWPEPLSVLRKLLNFAETQHLLGLKNEYIRICWLVSDQKLKVIVL